MSIVLNPKCVPHGARTSAQLPTEIEGPSASQPSEQDGFSYKDARSQALSIIIVTRF